MPYNLISDLEQGSVVDKQDRGLHYGDGLFETMLLCAGEIKYWSEHYSRLSRSAKKLYLDCPDKSWFEHHLQPFISLQQELVLKIILTRGSGGRGLSFPADLSSNVYLLKYPYLNNIKNQPVKAIISEVTLPSNLNLAGLKHLNRLDYILATQQLNTRTGFNEAILTDLDGNIIEGIISNIFFVKNDRLCTPDLETSGVDGVMRLLILKKMKQMGKEVNINRYSINDIIHADECFFSNSVQGIRPVTQIEDKQFEVGQLTKDLQKLFHGHSGI